MNIQKIVTEDPIKSQWLQLSNFMYPSNIERFAIEQKYPLPNDLTKAYISGCIKQSQAYFESAKNSPLDIKPLLVYYGTVCLLSGTLALVNGKIPEIKNHGMYLSQIDDQLANISIATKDTKNGALQLFSNTFLPGLVFSNISPLKFQDILSFIPEIRSDFLSCYREAQPHTISVQIVNKAKVTFERISLSEVTRFQEIEKTIMSIEGYKECYISPQLTKAFIILYRKNTHHEIGTYSVFGKKYFSLPIKNNGKNISVNSIIGFFMGLFTLSTLCRYHPEKWHPFVTNDTTGERLLVDIFISNAVRSIPNLVLNYIYKSNIQFIFHDDQSTNLSLPIYEDEIKEIVNELLQKGN